MRYKLTETQIKTFELCADVLTKDIDCFNQRCDTCIYHLDNLMFLGDNIHRRCGLLLASDLLSRIIEEGGSDD